MNKSFKNVQKSRAFRDLVIIFIVAIFAFVLATIFDLRERFDIWARQFGESLIQLDEIAILFTVLMLTFSIFSLRRWRELRVEITERKQVEEKMLQRNRELSVLYTIDRATTQTLDLEKILNDALKATLDVLEIEAGGIYLLNPDREILTLHVHRGVSDEFVKNVQHVKFGEGISGRAAAEKRPVVLDVMEYPAERLAPFIFKERIQTLASTPLLSGGGELVGAMNLVMRRPRTFSQEEYQLLLAVGQQLGGIVKNAQLYEKVKQELVERKRAEEALREREERFQTLANTTSTAIIIYYGERFAYVNKATELITGYSNEEIFKMHFWNLMHPEFRDLVRDRGLARQRGEDVQNRYEVKIICKDGSERWIDYTAGRIQWEDKPAIIGTAFDITDRKRAEEALSASEERYRTLFEGAAEGILVADIETKQFTYANPAICRMLGYTMEELTRLGVADIHPKEALDRVVAEFEAQARGEKILPPELPCLQKDGNVIYVSITTAPVVIEGRKCNVGFFTDLTERKKAEKALKQTEEQLRQSQKMEAIGKLAGGVAHDFNNLLTIIKGYSQFSLYELKDSDPLRGNIEEIRKAADRAADLTRQLLAFSRRQIMEFKVLDLNIILRNLDKMLRRVIGEDIELGTILADDLGRVKTDPGQIEQVIMNLAVNARDAMPNGGKLTIETSNVELDEEYAHAHIAVKLGRYVMISVSDTGVGMPPEVTERIFEPFFTTKEKGKGTGLGLSTVYGTVKQSAGNIWVYSEPGKGTTFKIYLPRVDEPLEELKEKTVKEGLPRGNETILVVEDNEEVRKVTVRILKRQGYMVLEGSQGDEAYNVCKQHKGPIHLLVTDVVMPIMNGHALAKRLEALYPNIKVLYMSGYTENAIVHHHVLEKEMNYIQKPFTVDGLARKVREVLDK